MASTTRNRWDLIRFLDLLDADIPVVDGQKIVAVSDNLSTRGTAEVEQCDRIPPSHRPRDQRRRSPTPLPALARAHQDARQLPLHAPRRTRRRTAPTATRPCGIRLAYVPAPLLPEGRRVLEHPSSEIRGRSSRRLPSRDIELFEVVLRFVTVSATKAAPLALAWPHDGADSQRRQRTNGCGSLVGRSLTLGRIGVIRWR